MLEVRMTSASDRQTSLIGRLYSINIQYDRTGGQILGEVLKVHTVIGTFPSGRLKGLEEVPKWLIVSQKILAL